MKNIIEITDFAAPELDVYARLTEGQLMCREHPEQGMFIAESPKVIERALAAGYQPVSLLMQRSHADGEAKGIIEKCPNVPVYVSDPELLMHLTGFYLTRGVLCAMRRRPLPEPETVCAGARRIAVLEDVMNPTNLGAVFRSAAALNVDAVLLSPGCCDPLYRRSVRVSMGTVFQVPWSFACDSPDEWRENGIGSIKNMGFECAALALSDNSVSIDDRRLASAERLAIVLGTEGDGLKAETISGCDYTVRIPMSNGVDSLNVAAAGAVAFWELCAKVKQTKE